MHDGLQKHVIDDSSCTMCSTCASREHCNVGRGLLCIGRELGPRVTSPRHAAHSPSPCCSTLIMPIHLAASSSSHF